MHLTDCFAPVLRYVTRFRAGGNDLQKSAEQVRTRLLDLLAGAEELAQREGFPPEEYGEARRAVSSWIDEVMAKSSWQGRPEWQKNALCNDEDSATGGAELFFQRLQQLPPLRREVREVFYLCLALGFAGNAGDAPPSRLLEEVRGVQLIALNGSASELLLQDKDLFAGGYPQDLPAVKDSGSLSRVSFTALAALAAPLLFFAALVACYRLSLATLSESFLKSLPF